MHFVRLCPRHARIESSKFDVIFDTKTKQPTSILKLGFTPPTLPHSYLLTDTI